MKLITFTPIITPFLIRPGANYHSETYQRFKEEIASLSTDLIVTCQSTEAKGYVDIAKDDVDIRLFILKKDFHWCHCRLHFFSQSVAVVEIIFDDLKLTTKKDIETFANKETDTIIKDIYPLLFERCSEISESKPEFLCNTSKEKLDPPKPLHTYWTSRAILLSPEEIKSNENKNLVEDWLKDTLQPNDAVDIIQGSKTCSMTWVNYIFVGTNVHEFEIERDAMILAQYYCTAQEKINKKLLEHISDTDSKRNHSSILKQLEGSRFNARMLQIQFNDHTNGISPKKSHLLGEILDHWKYKFLVENCHRMIEVCSSKIESSRNERKEKSSFYTDLILASIVFTSIFQLSLVLSEYSREYMVRPILDLHDKRVSWLLSLVASTSQDSILLGSVFCIIILFLVYLYAKKK